MDAEKMCEVEMKEFPSEIKDVKDTKEMEKTKEHEKGTADKKEEKNEKEEEEAEKKAEEKEINDKEEGSVYSKLTSPTEDVYNPVMPSSSSKRSKDTERKEKEIKEEEEEEEGNVYSKLKGPTEDIYNPAMSSSSSKRIKAEKVDKKEHENEEAEEDLYCKLKDPSDNVYMAAVTSSSVKQKEVNKKVRLYKRISAVLIILCVVLLAVILALSTKLNMKCPESADSKCTCEQCETMCTKVHSGCIECEEGWGKFEKSCYFKSRERLSWQKSREACQKKDADLAVIDNERVQKFLSKNSNLLYWIGLHYSEEQKWIWIYNTTQTQTYWDSTQPSPNSQGFCALINGQVGKMNNWLSNHCEVISFYFCQKRLSKE